MNQKEWDELREQNYALLPTSFTMLHNKLLEDVGCEPAVFFSKLLGKERFYLSKNQLTTDGFFYETIEHMEKKTKLSRHRQDRCIDILVERGLLITDVRKVGIAPRRYFQIRHDGFAGIVKSICKEFTNPEIPDTYKEDEQGLICKEETNRFVKTGQQERTYIIKNKSILNAKAYSGGKPPQQKTILPRKANNPLILVDTTEPPLARPEGVKPRFSKLHKIKRPTVTFDIQQIIDYWIKKGLPGHKEDSKAFDQAVIFITKALNSTLLEDYLDPRWHNFFFSVDTIKRAIDNFYLAAFDNRYEPLSLNTKQRLQTIRLKDFLYNRHSPEDRYKSHLFLYLSKPKLASESKYLAMKDDHTYCTKLVNEWYHQEFGGVVTEVSRSQQNSMILVGRKLEEFLMTHKDKLQMDEGMQIYGNRNPLNFLAGQLLRCASKMLRENDGLRAIFKPSWLISENMLSDRFVYFLKSERMMK
jgi:hypothetical protein